MYTIIYCIIYNAIYNMCNIMYIIYVVYLSGKYTACLSGKFLCRKTSLTGGFSLWLHQDSEVHI